jgi:hypothetical protein
MDGPKLLGLVSMDVANNNIINRESMPDGGNDPLNTGCRYRDTLSHRATDPVLLSIDGYFKSNSNIPPSFLQSGREIH